jgi:hypothetical protein
MSGEDSSTPVKGSKRKDPPAPSLTGTALQRAYDNAQRTLDRDAEILDQLRTRANILLTGLAIGGAVLGGSLSNTAHRPLTAALVWSLGSAIVLCFLVLWPTRDHGKFTVRISSANKDDGRKRWQWMRDRWQWMRDRWQWMRDRWQWMRDRWQRMANRYPRVSRLLAGVAKLLAIAAELLADAVWRFIKPWWELIRDLVSRERGILTAGNGPRTMVHGIDCERGGSAAGS